MAEDSSIFQEIDESLRVEKLQQFWQRSGNLVIAVCIGIVLATIGWVVWKNHRNEVHMQETAVMIRAQELQSQGHFAQAAQMLEGAGAGKGSLSELAGIELAQAYLKAGDKDKALAAYTQVAQGSGDKALRDYASLQASLISGAAPPIASGPYASSARELEAVSLIKAGKNGQARGILKPIAQDDHAPPSQRARAQELLDSLSGDSQ